MLKNWELICDETYVLNVPGGMLVRTFSMHPNDTGECTSESLCFVNGDTGELTQWAIGVKEEELNKETTNEED